MTMREHSFLRTFCWIAAMAGGVLHGEILTLENATGAKITAKLVCCIDGKLTVRRTSDNKTFDLPLDQLSEKSRADVKTWQDKGGGLLEDYQIEVSTGKNRRTQAGDDFDDKRVNLDPIVTVRNPDPRVPTRAAKLTVLFLGRPVVDGKALHVFRTKTFDLPSLDPATSRNFAVGKISAAYDSRGYAKFGARYIGYVAIVHNEGNTEVFSSRSVPTTLVQGKELVFLRLKDNATYDKNFKPIKMPVAN